MAKSTKYGKEDTLPQAKPKPFKPPKQKDDEAFPAYKPKPKAIVTPGGGQIAKPYEPPGISASQTINPTVPAVRPAVNRHENRYDYMNQKPPTSQEPAAGQGWNAFAPQSQYRPNPYGIPSYFPAPPQGQGVDVSAWWKPGEAPTGSTASPFPQYDPSLPYRPGPANPYQFSEGQDPYEQPWRIEGGKGGGWVSPSPLGADMRFTPFYRGGGNHPRDSAGTPWGQMAMPPGPHPQFPFGATDPSSPNYTGRVPGVIDQRHTQPALPAYTGAGESAAGSDTPFDYGGGGGGGYGGGEDQKMPPWFYGLTTWRL